MNNSRKFAYGKPGLFQALGTIIAIPIISILTSDACLAQIIPDTTLGNQNSRVMSGVNIKGNGADLIEGGVQSGTNLFHSFAEFNVNNGQRVYFANPTGIANILSRVTGNNPSNILGTLGVNGAANLFLLNPKGIIFGPNAQLDIQGSFLVTTANSFQFPDGSEFSATNPQAPPLLTMTVPVGVQFGSQQTASITNQGNLVAGKDLTLSAENLDLQGTLQAGGDLILQAQDTLTVRDSASNPFIAAAGGNLLAQGNQKVDIFALNNPNSGFFSGGDMVLQSENTIGGDAHFWAGGNFRIEKLNGDLGNLFSPDDPVIRASGDVSFDSYTGASLHILAGGSVNISGNVTITGLDSTSNSIQETVMLSDGKTEIDIDGSATPTLDIRAGVNSNIIGTPGFTPNLPIVFNGQNPNTSNESTNANITIQGTISNISGSKSNSEQIFITNQYKPNTKLAGDITTGIISTDGDVTVDSRGDITTNGKINTNADIISQTPSRIAGNVTILSRGDIHILNNIEASSNRDTDNYNEIAINSKEGSVYLNGSNLDVTNTGSGYAGNIYIHANEKISILNGSKIMSQGNFGYIDIDTGSLSVNNSEINTNNNGSDNAGFIYIHANDKISILNGSKIISQGNFGFILIDTGSLSLNDKSEINTNNNNSGNAPLNIINTTAKIKKTETYSPEKKDAGSIIINAKGQISILNDSKISSKGNYGYIDITTQNLLLRRHSKISTTAGNDVSGGNSGSIIIDAKDGFVVAVPTEDSDIIANAFGGQGGKIKITANRVLGFQNRGKLSSAELNKIETNGISDISASSDVVGADGEVAIEALSIDPSQGLVALPTNLVDPSRLIAQGCSSNSNVAKGQSEFVITGRGGLPPSPDDTLKPGAILPEWVVNNMANNSNYSENMTESNLRQLSSNTSAPLVEAVGMVRSANGDIVLTAQSTTTTLLQSGLSTQACNVTQGNVR
ncbi:MAG: filamentous hemagglutinin N-terminal domain-containing protein [Nostoc sp. ZfuVER08]|nr:filamentous hemagglutinin N-terminal domain-containing protein [Nostoc sp. ZfuVER08]